MGDPRAKLQSLSDDYQKLQSDLQSSILARQKLETQQQENTAVARELDSAAAASARVFKQIGPILLPQEPSEAQQTIKGRLTFIESELKRLDERIAATQEKSEAAKQEIYQLQVSMQAPAQQQAPQAQKKQAA